jgi:hypothetical protein
VVELPPAPGAFGLPDDWVIVAPAAGQTLYRVVGGDPLTLRDFKSNRDKGEPQRLRAGEHAIGYLGISLWADEDQAHAIAAKGYPKVGRAVAAITLSGDMGLARTRRAAGHHTAWGSPEAFLEAATLV